MCSYLSQLHDALSDFNEFLPPSIDVKELENYSTFFKLSLPRPLGCSHTNPKIH